MKGKLKITNILACILVVVMAFATINIINIDQQKNNKDANTNVSAGESYTPPVTRPSTEQNDPSNSPTVTPTTDTVSYTGADYLVAIKKAIDVMENGRGYKAILNGKLNISAGINIKQTVYTEKQRFSDDSYYLVAKSTGTFKSIYQEVYATDTRNGRVTYLRESEKSETITEPRQVFNEEQVLAREGNDYGKFPMVVNEDTVLLYDSVSQPNGYNPNSSEFFKAYYNTATGQNNYEYKLPLDNVKSVEFYKYCIRTNSLDVANGDFPIFTKVILSFVLDEKGNFVSYSLDVVYKMYTKGIGLEAICAYTSTDVFSKMDEYQMKSRPSWAR